MARVAVTPEVKNQRMAIGARLHDARMAICDLAPSRAKNFAALCARVGASPRTWYHWENGHAMPGDAVLKLVALEQISAAWLLTGNGPMFTSEWQAVA
jgi:Bacteriophage CI repressor helix-turn-helix domain